MAKNHDLNNDTLSFLFFLKCFGILSFHQQIRISDKKKCVNQTWFAWQLLTVQPPAVAVDAMPRQCRHLLISRKLGIEEDIYGSNTYIKAGILVLHGLSHSSANPSCLCGHPT